MSDQSKPIVQVKQQTPWGQYTDNVRLEGNQTRKLTSYTRLWEDVLVPRGGLESLLLHGLLYTSSIAFCLSWGGYFTLAALIVVAAIVIGGFTATVLEPSLTAPYLLRCATIALGFVITML